MNVNEPFSLLFIWDSLILFDLDVLTPVLPYIFKPDLNLLTAVSNSPCVHATKHLYVLDARMFSNSAWLRVPVPCVSLLGITIPSDIHCPSKVWKHFGKSGFENNISIFLILNVLKMNMINDKTSNNNFLFDYIIMVMYHSTYSSYSWRLCTLGAKYFRWAHLKDAARHSVDRLLILECNNIFFSGFLREWTMMCKHPQTLIQNQLMLIDITCESFIHEHKILHNTRATQT